MQFNKSEHEAVHKASIEVLDASQSEFFAPATYTVLDGLFAQYEQYEADINRCADFFTESRNSSAFHYFLEGNHDINRGRTTLTFSAGQLFDKTGAMAALDASFWSKALALTDVLSCMPQKRVDEWHKSISEHSCPKFERETVEATLLDLLQKRSGFMAERVDGLFQALSRDHVTNVPEGFSRRMILNYVLSSYGYAEHSHCGVINDLLCVISKMMGYDEPNRSTVYRIVDSMQRSGKFGEWVSIGGGVMRIRIYKKGTGHLEVHPDMAWRLNCILANLYPLAIPSHFRAKPKSKSKEFERVHMPLSWAAQEALAYFLPKQGEKTIDLYSHSHKEHALEEAARVLNAIGGVAGVGRKGCRVFEFDYAPRSILLDIIQTGTIPEHKSHQYYPTPARLAERAVIWADIGDSDRCLEPSAGCGGISKHMPINRTTCVEIAPLHVKVLQEQGFDTVEADFLAWAATAPKFDKIVMNPPFSEGRALAHTKGAIGLLKPKGTLVAILPASNKDRTEKLDLPIGYSAQWSESIENEFQGTSVAVVILKVSAA